MKLSKNYGPGVVFISISAAFGLGSVINYPFGSFAKPGPGLFPIVVSTLLFIIGCISIAVNMKKDADSAFVDLKALSLIVAGLLAFALCTTYINMAAGIITLVFVTSFAIKEQTPKYQNLKIIVVLLIAASAFKYGLGLNLPLWK